MPPESQDHPLTGAAMIAIGCPPAYMTEHPEKYFWTGRPCRNGHTAPRFRAGGTCSECSRERMRARYAGDPNRHLERQREYRQRDPEANRERSRRWVRGNLCKELALRANARAARRGTAGAITPEEVAAIFERDRHCLACGVEERLGIDHIQPLGKGGPNAATNLQILCDGCNRRKGTRSADYRQKGRES